MNTLNFQSIYSNALQSNKIKYSYVISLLNESICVRRSVDSDYCNERPVLQFSQKLNGDISSPKTGKELLRLNVRQYSEKPVVKHSNLGGVCVKY